jgi:hypothetical protein
MIHIRDRGVVGSGSEDEDVRALPNNARNFGQKTCILLQRRPAVDCITVTTCSHHHLLCANDER